MTTCVSLNPTTDLTLNIPFFKRNRVLRVPDIFSYPGGKPTNTARALFALGHKVSVTGFCADAEKNKTDCFMKKHGVKPLFVPVKGKSRGCVLINEYKNGSETVINSEGSIKITETNIQALLKTIKRLAPESFFMVFSGSLPRALSENFYYTALKTAAPFTKTFLDTAGRPLKKALYAAPDILKINEDEFAGAFNIKNRSKNKIKEKCLGLIKKHNINAVIITMHEKGAVLISKKESLFCPAAPVKKAISPVGAGDAFSAGFIRAAAEKKGRKKSLETATAAAGAALLKPGSCFIDKKDVLYFMKKIKAVKY